MAIIKYIIKVLSFIGTAISYLYKYRTVYTVTGFFATRKFSPAKALHRYAVLIAARNEEAVIGHLLDSIAAQDYPGELISVFVAADNCTDRTAGIAREHGAACYERHDTERRTKGYALQFLVEEIRRDFGIDTFDGYFIFDADNLLSPDYVSRMNEAFDSGEKIVTSYRNTKNFNDNWIAASYGVHWLRTIRTEHRPRSLFRLATRIQGTGFLFANELIRHGWNYVSLTEDRAFCADAVAKGYTISYCDAAEFYDEQPVSLKIAMRQRIRWARGHLEAFFETGPKLFAHIFVTRNVPHNNRCDENGVPLSRGKRFINNLRLRFMSFDVLTVVFPKSLFNVLKRILTCILRSVLVLGGAYQVTAKLAPGSVRFFLEHFGADLSGGCLRQIVYIFMFAFTSILSAYLVQIVTAAYVYIIERKRIPRIPFSKKILYCLTFPIFDVMGRIALVIAMFGKVEWKPIPHNVGVSVDEIK